LKRLLVELEELIDRLMRYNVRLVILFGSRVRGDYTGESDVDVLIVADELPEDPRESFAIIYRYVSPKIHPICLRTTSFLRKLRGESTFIMEILEDGRVVYADGKFLEEVMSIYRDVRSKWVRKGKTWERIST
jgi:predicted nucleotidyltransferase